VVTSLYPTLDRPTAGPFVRRRVEALRERGVIVDVVAARTYRQSGLRRHLSMLAQGLRPRRRPDGVEGHVLFPAGLIALLLARLHRRPLLVYAHGADVGRVANRTRFHRALASLVARSADAVVTNSATTAGRVASLGGTARVVSPGVDLERFRPANRVAARRAHDLPTESRIAMYVGGLSTRKGADVFAEALGAAPGWQGVIVGEGELGPSIRSRFPALRMAGSVEPDAVPGWLEAADVVVVPSRDEPLGLAAVEALACGVPVVASAVGGLADVVVDGQNGLLVPPGDSAAIVAALDRLGDEGLREQLARDARASVAGHDLRLATDAMAGIWQSLGVRT
jgi:glycosyltransferase involved in cell wall biosynthesis